MTNLKRVGINIISGGAGYVIPVVVNLLSTSFVINALGEEAFGLQTLANVLIGYMIVADMGLDIPITQRVAELHAKGDFLSKARFLAATIKIYFLIGVLGVVILLALTNTLIEVLNIPVDLHYEAEVVFYMTSGGFMASILNMWGRAVFNGIHRYDISNAITIINNIFGILFGILLIVFGYGVIGFFFARISGFILSSLAYTLLARKFMPGFNFFPIIDRQIWSFLKKQIGYGFALRMSGMIFAKTDQAIISSKIGIGAVSVYSLPYLLANTLSGFLASITHFSFPMASALNTTGGSHKLEEFFVKISKLIVGVATMTFFPLIVLGDKFIALWINPELALEGQSVMWLLLIAFYFNTCLSTAVIAFMVGVGQLKIFTPYGVLRGILLLVGFLIFIPKYGLNGAGYAYFLSLILDVGFFIYAVKMRLQFNLKQLLLGAYVRPFFLGFVLAALLLPFRDRVNDWTALIGLSAIFCILYFVLALAIRIITPSERKVMTGYLEKLIRQSRKASFSKHTEKKIE